MTLDPKTPVTLPLGLVNGLLAYLGQRPYVEVQGVISAIHGEVMPQIQPKPAEPAAQPPAAPAPAAEPQAAQA